MLSYAADIQLPMGNSMLSTTKKHKHRRKKDGSKPHQASATEADIALQAQLFLHISKNNLDEIKELVASGVPLTCTGKARYFSQQGPHSNETHAGLTPMTYAAGLGRLEIMRYFVEDRQVKVRTSDDHGNTPLLMASMHGNIEMVDYLLSHGAKLREYNQERANALMCALATAKFNTAMHLLNQPKVDLTAIDAQGRSCLYYAFAYATDSNQNYEFAAHLIEKGMNPFEKAHGMRTPIRGMSPTADKTAYARLKEMCQTVPRLDRLLRACKCHESTKHYKTAVITMLDKIQEELKPPQALYPPTMGSQSHFSLSNQ